MDRNGRGEDAEEYQKCSPQGCTFPEAALVINPRKESTLKVRLGTAQSLVATSNHNLGQRKLS